MKAIQYAVVVSTFNQEITDKLLEGTLSTLFAAGAQQKDVKIVRVPGAIEIPLVAKLLAKSKQHDAIICLGAVIRGETDHYDYVCEQVSQGCQKIMLDYEIPVLFGVLTTNNLSQAYDRIGGKEGHKGVDVANAAIEMTRIVTSLTINASIENISCQ